MRRYCVLLGVLAAALTLTAVSAYAATPTLHLTKSDAGSGDKVPFSISNTSAGATYVLKIDDNEVKKGTDDGTGIKDDFTMPDLGNNAGTISVEATVVQGDTETHTSDHVNYTVVGSGSTGTTSPAFQTAPVQQPITAAQPVPSATPIQARRRTAPAERKTTTQQKTTTQHKQKATTKQKSTNTGSSTPNTATPSAPAVSHAKPTPVSPATPPSSSPPAVHTTNGPAGPAGNPPPGFNSTLSAATPLSGVSNVGLDGGFPVGWLILLGLFVLAGIAAAAVRFGPQWLSRLSRPRSAKEMDDARISALSRAAHSGAELQQRLAARKASR